MDNNADPKFLEEKIKELEKTVQTLKDKEAVLEKENSELKKIKYYYDALMQNTEDFVLICDSDGIPQAFNLSYKKKTEELLNIEMKPGVQAYKIAGYKKIIEYWESLQKKALKGEKFVAEYSDKKRNKHYETMFCPIKEGRNITGFTEITRDITIRKKIEKELQASNAFNSSLLENSPVAIIVINPDTSIKYVNPLFEKLSGYTSEEIIGISFPYPWMVGDIEYGDIEVRMKEGVHQSERQYKKKNGEYSWVDLDVTPIYHNGELSYSLAIWVDISDRKKSELEKKELEEKLRRSQTMESLGLLASGVAHDLNNVLAGIVSYPDMLLLDMPVNSSLRKPLETIRESGNRAAAIVQDLLTIARGVATEKKSLNLNDLINEYIESPEAKKLQHYNPSMILKTNLDSTLLNIKGSYIHLRKALMNLVLNASEAIDDIGIITISTMNCFLDKPLRAYDDVKTGKYAIISVADNGAGIEPSDLDRIFEPFYTKKILGRSGTGLGLAVVWNVIREHNGYINVKSDNSGSAFDLYLPVTQEESSIDNSGFLLEDIKGNGEKILIVDDVDSQREICSQIIEKLGYQTHTLASGEEALEYLEKEKADLVLLDMIMDPGMNGRETYERILKINPHQKVILVSGYVETGEVKTAQQSGAGQLIKKPYTLKSIGVAVKKALNSI